MSLEGERIAVMVDQQYQEIEVWYPAYRFIEAGAEAAWEIPAESQEFS